MKFVFLMDPLDSVVVEKDTSYILMLGAHRRGHEIYYLAPGNISLLEGSVRFRVERVTPTTDAETPFITHETAILTDKDVAAVFIRTDPPFDNDYLAHTWLLDQLPASTLVINSPSGLRTVNEKIWATQFTDIIPRTLVTRSKIDFIDFLNHEHQLILKPTDGYGGQSIFHVKQGDTNALVMFETVTAAGTRDAIVQAYVPEASVGDKRILLLAGEPLGAVLRVHNDTDHRNNVFAGGSTEATTITQRDQVIIDTLKPHLAELGLLFVGIDIIGDRLIEVNVTSPTCLQEINRLENQTLEDTIIASVESLIAERSICPR